MRDEFPLESKSRRYSSGMLRVGEDGLRADDCHPGYLLKENKDYGAEVALGSSILLVTAATGRCMKTKWRAPVPLGLFATGGLATYYFLKKYREFNYGV